MNSPTKVVAFLYIDISMCVSGTITLAINAHSTTQAKIDGLNLSEELLDG